MVEPIDIAIEIHGICEVINIPQGLSPEHNVTQHSATTKIYAKAINGAGIHCTGKQATEAIIQASGWDRKGRWPGHPSAQAVIEVLHGNQD